jgi:hypothetical protein
VRRRTDRSLVLIIESDVEQASRFRARFQWHLHPQCRFVDTRPPLLIYSAMNIIILR